MGARVLVISHDYDLTAHNTLGLPARAECYAEFSNRDELAALLCSEQRIKVLGAGSNLIFQPVITGLVIKSAMRAITAQDGIVWADAGVNWHEFVLASQQYGYGLENLAHIPGTVGAAPVLNIGAYGVEVCERIVAVETVYLPTGKWHSLAADECQFAYRDSIFKRQAGQWLIVRVGFALGETFAPNLDYAGLQDAAGLDARALIDYIGDIRWGKLPRPESTPNVGSFFKNPVIAADEYARLEGIKGFPQKDGRIKVPAAALIERCGFKGRWQGKAGVYDKHALVLIAKRGATYDDIIALSDTICAAVRDRFGIELEREPQFFC